MAVVGFREPRPGATWDTSAYTRPNGKFVDVPEYGKAFVPAPLPSTIQYDAEMIKLLTLAERTVGELRGRGRGIPNPNMLIRAHLKREAVLSSRIEGTMASLDDLNMQEALGNISPADSQNLRLFVVQNYVQALEHSLEDLRSGNHKIGLDLTLKAHEILMRGVRGGDLFPGKLRDVQNIIVLIEGMHRTIVYVPPPPKMIRSLLNDLWAFIGDNNMPALVKCAVAHYQFEAIHPFSDGNGRVGRLLVPLILHAAGVMEQPLLYVSAYLEDRRWQYYGGLRQVSETSAWPDWIKFFLTAFAEQAGDAIRSIDKIDALRAEYVARLRSRNAKAGALELADALLGNPYVTIPRAARMLNMSYAGAAATVRSLEAAGILERTKIRARAKVFMAREAASLP